MKKVLLILFTFCTITTFAQYCKDNEVNKFIKEWIGKPYRLGGSTKTGIDCSNFTRTFYKAIYNCEIGYVAYKQWNETKRIYKTDLQIGDILFFHSSVSPSGWHCGIYIGDNKFVHASNRMEGVKISDLDEYYYKKNYKGAGRL